MMEHLAVEKEDRSLFSMEGSGCLARMEGAEHQASDTSPSGAADFRTYTMEHAQRSSGELWRQVNVDPPPPFLRVWLHDFTREQALTTNCLRTVIIHPCVSRAWC